MSRLVAIILCLLAACGCEVSTNVGDPADAGNTCVRATCDSLGATCGELDDGCGGRFSCGTCQAPDTCGGGGVPNRCGNGSCAPETNAQFCARLEKDCDLVTAVDNCGAMRSVTCGSSCPAGLVCGGSGISNLCARAGCTPELDDVFCARLGKDCGTVADKDNCGAARTAGCGSGCAAPESCGAVTANVCGCVAESDGAFCARLGKECGTFAGTDDCGAPRTADCGDPCLAPESCGAVTANTCGCAPETDEAFCARLGEECGAFAGTDNCGAPRTADCGDPCVGPESCGAVAPNACGCAAETDAAFCSRLGKECGSFAGTDDCGAPRTADCGDPCAAPESCGAVTANACGCAAKSDEVLCAELGKTCGAVAATDDCGASRTLQCGDCVEPQTCGAEAPNVCGCVAEADEAFCARMGKNCGTATGTDNCGAQRSASCGVCGTCAAPIQVPSGGGMYWESTSGGSALSSSCGGGAAPEKVFAWTPTISGTVTASTCGSSFDTTLSVWEGACGTGPLVTCNDNSSSWCYQSSYHALVSFYATAGRTYYFAVDGASGGSGSIQFKLASPEGTCSSPIAIPGDGGYLLNAINGSSTGSASCGGSGYDRVHRWTPSRSGTATITVQPDYWPSVVFVRRGSCTGTEVACDNKTSQWPTNTISLPVTAGTEYFIWVGHGSYTGEIIGYYHLTVSLP